MTDCGEGTGAVETVTTTGQTPSFDGISVVATARGPDGSCERSLGRRWGRR